MRKLSLTAIGILLMFETLSASSKPLRIVQLDLARQMETTTFVSNYIDVAASFGYNALQLYLEGRVGTKTFSLPAGERYTAEEMKGIVAHAAEKGIVVIPVVSFLGHAEHFFKYPGLEALSESREGRYRIGSGHSTFCHSVPGAVPFFERYIADLCEIFTGPYFHAGFDEAWNSGLCSLCAPKEKAGELFAEEVMNIYRILKSHGKRMMMWDDFFGFHPKALDLMPRDIVMMHWNYGNISSRGARFNFAGRLREDSLAKYSSMGFDAIACSWYYPDNIRSFVQYAHRSKAFGYLQTQWEDLIPNFHGGSLPGVLAVSLALDDPPAAQANDVFLRAVRRLMPSLSDLEKDAVVRLLESSDDRLALKVLERSAMAQTLGDVSENPLCERAYLDDILCRARMAVARAELRRAERILNDPRRTDKDVAAARSLLTPLPDIAQSVADRRRRQFAAWRRGCSPEAVAKGPISVASTARNLLKSAATARADEKRLAVELTLVDYYGVPRWTVEGRFEDGWREIAKGVWKPSKGEKADFTHYTSFQALTMPSELRISYCGFGNAQLRFISLEDRDSRVVPVKVLSSSGRVQNPEAVLTDDYDTVTFGRFGYRVQFFDDNEAKALSVLTLEMGKKEW